MKHTGSWEMRKMQVDLNCDLGESFGNYTCGLDEEVLPYISSANVACGFHASDPMVMKRTVELAKKYGVSIGAHPGFPDLQGFGRRNMMMQPEEIKALIQYQIGALDAFCRASGVLLKHVKPHGALYNMAAKDISMARAICQSIAQIDSSLVVLAQGGSCLAQAAGECGLPFAKEVFADRAYEENGTLVARSKPGAVITEEKEAVDRVISMVKYKKVKAITGKEIPVQADSICVHGDGKKAVTFVKLIGERLQAEGVAIASF